MADDALLKALYSGVFEDPLWDSFLQLLRSRTDADYASVTFRRADAPANELVEIASGRSAPPQLYKEYFENLYGTDPVDYYSLKLGRLYCLQELLDLSVATHADYYHQFLKPMQANDVRILRVEEPSGYNAWLTLSRRKGRFGNRAERLTESLSNHLSLALRSFATLQTQQIRETMYANAIEKLNFGCVTLDMEGEIVEIDGYTEALLTRASALLRNAHGRLVLTSRVRQQSMKDTIHSFLSDSARDAMVIQLSEEPRLSMLIVPMRRTPVSGRVTPVVIGYVHGDAPSAHDRCDQLVQLFGLSRTEAQLALAISNGMTLSEAAAELGLTAETARNYSKRIFAKTGTHRQAELVRLLLTSVLTLA